MITKIKLPKINGVLNDNIYAEVRYISEENFGDVLSLYDKVNKDLNNKSWLKFRDISYLKSTIDNNGFIIGCYVNNILIASALCETPCDDDLDIILSTGIHENDIKNTYISGYVMVDPIFRGNSLHSVLLDLRINLSILKGKKHIVTVIAEDNIYSLRNVLSLGFEEKSKKVREDGVIRSVLVKNLCVNETQEAVFTA